MGRDYRQSNNVAQKPSYPMQLLVKQVGEKKEELLHMKLESVRLFWQILLHLQSSFFSRGHKGGRVHCKYPAPLSGQVPQDLISVAPEILSGKENL